VGWGSGCAAQAFLPGRRRLKRFFRNSDARSAFIGAEGFVSGGGGGPVCFRLQKQSIPVKKSFHGSKFNENRPC
jgi:hypothetical protein